MIDIASRSTCWLIRDALHFPLVAYQVAVWALLFDLGRKPSDLRPFSAALFAFVPP
jgi:hypothetical protein